MFKKREFQLFVGKKNRPADMSILKGEWIRA